jgi:autophagy-related protein 27
MRLTSTSSPRWAVLLVLTSHLSSVSSLITCDTILAGNHKYNLDPLKGPHSVTISHFENGNYHNWTYTADICSPLKKKPKEGEEGAKGCPKGTRVCAIERVISQDKKQDLIESIFPLAGELQDHKGGPLDEKIEDLGSSGSNEDSKKQGIRITLKGGILELPNHQKRRQQAIIELLCDENRTGLEGEFKPEDEYEPGESSAFRPREDDGGDGKEGDGDKKPEGSIQLGEGKNASLTFYSYGPLGDSSDTDVLRLTWLTKHVCINKADDGNEDGSKKSSWGFFTWLFVL